MWTEAMNLGGLDDNEALGQKRLWFDIYSLTAALNEMVKNVSNN